VENRDFTVEEPGATHVMAVFATSMNCYFPMPFADGAKIQLINESEEKVENLFYYVDYEAYDSKVPQTMFRPPSWKAIFYWRQLWKWFMRLK
jgi:hypothetical protein